MWIPWLGRLQAKVFSLLEGLFQSLATKVYERPWTTIFISVFLCLAALPGFLRFRYENESIKLWISETSDTRQNHDWLMRVFPPDTRFHAVIIRADNVLMHEVLLAMYDLHQRVQNIRTDNNVTWDNSCRRLPVVKDPGARIVNGSLRDAYAAVNATTAIAASVSLYPSPYCQILASFETACMELSILELFAGPDGYNHTKIKRMKQDEIIYFINSKNLSGIFNTRRDFRSLLGGISYGADGQITGAKATLMMLFGSVNTTEVTLNPVSDGIEVTTRESLEFERELLEQLLIPVDPLAKIQVLPNVQYSYGNLTHAGPLRDGIKLIGGYAALIVYLVITVWRPWIVLAGICTAALATVSSSALGLAIGIPFTSLSTLLPFLLIGIGVDDLYVFVKTLDKEDKPGDSDSKQRLVNMAKRAGLAVTVTSVTDVCAFLTGATSILPALRGFSVHCSIGICLLYLLSITFLLACIAIDEKRKDKWFSGLSGSTASVGGEDKSDTSSSGSLAGASAAYHLDCIANYARLVTGNAWIQSCLILTGLALLGLSIWGNTQLREEFDAELFISPDGYLGKFYQAEHEYFPELGESILINFADVDHSKEFTKIRRLLRHLKNRTELVSSVEDWTEDFLSYLAQHVWPRGEHAAELSSLLSNATHLAEKLTQFLFSFKGASIRDNFKLGESKPLECGGSETIMFSKVRFRHVKLKSSEERIAAMNAVKKMLNHSNISGRVFAMSRDYSNWETDEVVRIEIYRNMLLMFGIVFLITFTFLVDLTCSLVVLISVVMTVTNIMGFMFFWGLTLSAITSNILIISVGLSIDFAAHIAFAYLSSDASNRCQRAEESIKEVGPAIFHGGMSTFVVFVPIAASEGYVFLLIFKMMTMTVWFGLFNGLCLVPTILALVGPEPPAASKPVEDRLADINATKGTTISPQFSNKGYVN